MAAAAALATPALYPAFFFVLGKAAKSARNAVIPTYPMHRPHGLQGSLKRRYKHPSLLPSMGTTRQKSSCRNRLQNGPHSLLRMKVGTHSPSPTELHTRAYTPKHGAFQMGVVSLPSEYSARSQTSPGRVSERRTLPLGDLGREVLSKNAESLRSSDALMRVAAPRRRGPAGLRNSIDNVMTYCYFAPLFVANLSTVWYD